MGFSNEVVLATTTITTMAITTIMGRSRRSQGKKKRLLGSCHLTTCLIKDKNNTETLIIYFSSKVNRNRKLFSNCLRQHLLSTTMIFE
jgi:hypothetical protein